MSAPESPLAVTVLQGSRLRSGQPQLTLQENLGAVPGVFVQNDANFAQDLRISIRGFGARAAFGIRGIRLLLDGIPESAPDGQAQVDNLDLATIGRIEVLRGAAGGLYGNASGGVISLSSDPVEQKNTAALRLTGGSFGYRQVHASASGRFRQSGLRVSLTHQGLDGYRDHARFRSSLANARWQWTPDTTLRLSVLLNYVNSPRADDAGALTLAQAETERRAANPGNLRFQAGESVQQGRVGLVLEKNWSAGQRLRLRTYSTWRDFESRLGFQNGGQVAFQRWFAGGGAQYDWRRRAWQGSLGLDIDRQRDQRQRFDNLEGQRGPKNLDQDETFSGAGLFALAEWRPAARWTLSGGLRADWVELRVADHFDVDGLQSGQSRYRRLSPWGGLVWRLWPRLHAYANAATNFETPTLTELSNNPDNAGGFNATLRAQRTLSLEAGLRGRWPANLAWELALFRATTQDELTPYELVDFPGRTFYRNAGSSLRQGLELSLSWMPLAGCSVLVQYTDALFRYEQFESPAGNFSGRHLPGLPQRWGLLELRYEREAGWFAVAQWRYTGRLFADDANATGLAPYLLLNGRLGYRRHWWGLGGELFLGIDNAAGQSYFNNIRLNAAAGRYYEPGARQFVFGGLGLRW